MLRSSICAMLRRPICAILRRPICIMLRRMIYDASIPLFKIVKKRLYVYKVLNAFYKFREIGLTYTLYF